MFLRVALPVAVIAAVLAIPVLTDAGSAELMMGAHYNAVTPGMVLEYQNPAFINRTNIKAVFLYSDGGFSYRRRCKVLPRRTREDRATDTIEFVVGRLRALGMHEIDFYVGREYVGYATAYVPEPQVPGLRREYAPPGDWIFLDGLYWGNRPPRIWLERGIMAGRGGPRRIGLKVCRKSYGFDSRDGGCTVPVRLPGGLAEGLYYVHARTMMGDPAGPGAIIADPDEPFHFPIDPPAWAVED